MFEKQFKETKTVKDAVEIPINIGFMVSMGTTPPPQPSALQNERLKIAKELLLSGDINVSEAANIIGYKSLGYFG